jgi:hypothetical protein
MARCLAPNRCLLLFSIRASFGAGCDDVTVVGRFWSQFSRRGIDGWIVLYSYSPSDTLLTGINYPLTRFVSLMNAPLPVIFDRSNFIYFKLESS